MRRSPLLLLVLAAGCRGGADPMPLLVEQQISAVAPLKAVPDVVPCAAEAPAPAGPPDLPELWRLALANNPSLREAAAEVEAARGRRIQAAKYPNPKIAYHVEELGSAAGGPGNESVEATQEILTAGKRRLAMAAADRGLDAAAVALLGRMFEVLTRVRRAYYEYLGLAAAYQVNREVVAALAQGVELTRKLVEEVKNRPRTDLLRLQTLLEQARVNEARARTNLVAAWRQLAAEVGVPELPPPPEVPPLPEDVPRWDAEAVAGRVQTTHTELRQAALEAERARLEYERARAEAVPNVTVGGGYIRGFVEQTGGGIVTVETAIPVWDCKQGLIHEAQARRAQALAAERVTALRLVRDTAEAFARYEGARQQSEKMATTVVPSLEESLRLVREGYQAGAAGLGFADVQLAVEALNDARLRLADTRRELWRAVADLQGLMQLDLDDDCVLTGE